MKCANPREHVAQVQLRLRDFELRGRGYDGTLRLEVRFLVGGPRKMRIRARPRMWPLDSRFGDVEPGREWIEDHFRVQIHGRIIGTQRQIPAMQAANFGAALQHPVISFGLRVNDEPHVPTHAKIIAAR